MAFKPAASKTLATSNARRTTNQVDEDEFAGLWINVGVVTADESDEEDSTTKFNRLPRGIAVSDLTEHRIYANSYERNPEWAEEAQIVNALIQKIREKAVTLEEGEAMPINLSVQLYRRQEQVESVNTPNVSVDLDSLFDS